MKKLFALLMIVGFLAITGCATTGGSGSAAQEAAILTAIELGGYNAGYYVGKSKTEADDIAVADFFAIAQNGTLTPAQMTEAFEKFKIDNPQLSGSLWIILKRMGGTFTADGGLVSLSGIPVAYWDTIGEGYVAGYAMGKLGQKGIKPSAVKAKLPKK